MQRVFEFADTALAAERHLGLADQVGQGRAQFVGHIGVEAFELLVGLLHPLHQGVELGHPGVELFGRALHHQALVEPPRRDAVHLPRQREQRAQLAAHQPLDREARRRRTEQCGHEQRDRRLAQDAVVVRGVHLHLHAHLAAGHALGRHVERHAAAVRERGHVVAKEFGAVAAPQLHAGG
ncbi:hypothetical protein D9M69_452610 [compost metagenome]